MRVEDLKKKIVLKSIRLPKYFVDGKPPSRKTNLPKKKENLEEIYSNQVKQQPEDSTNSLNKNARGLVRKFTLLKERQLYIVELAKVAKRHFEEPSARFLFSSLIRTNKCVAKRPKVQAMYEAINITRSVLISEREKLKLYEILFDVQDCPQRLTHQPQQTRETLAIWGIMQELYRIKRALSKVNFK